MTARIEDYALIGNTYTTALVCKNGSIDWLCMPRFDSPAIFCSLLGTLDNGRWLIAPSDKIRRTRRRYRDSTLILETEYETDEGVVAVIDFMPRPTDRDRRELVRIVEGRRGKVHMRLDLVFRFDYGLVVPWLRRDECGLHAFAGPDGIRMCMPVEFEGEGSRIRSEFVIEAGKSLPFRMIWYPSYRPLPTPSDPFRELEETESWWRNWADQCTYRGKWKEAVVRSLVTLKGLTYSPTGGIVAAATTSLPEKIGGVRNWDYRYCWLRDATFTLYSLLVTGFRQEAMEWREWLLRAVAGKPEQLQIMYGVGGERRLHEVELSWLSGYEESRPVRIGNDAHPQMQLDVYGEVMDVFHVARKMGLHPHDEAWDVQKTMLDFLEQRWEEPDEGLWEVRGPKRDFTHSKILCWVAYDRAVKAVERFGKDGPVDRWRMLRDRIHRDVCKKGYNPDRKAFTWFYGGHQLDASLLMIPLIGFLPHDDERVVNTVNAIKDELCEDGLILRYTPDENVDGLPGDEGTFIACSFWMVDNLVLQGRREEAEELFEHLLSLRNDLGLLAEEYEPRLKRQVGNFPQAFSHVGLINSAHNLSSGGEPAKGRACE
ncbi:glycoside hydrolase family 15 protein [Telmatospirillum sp. J64-1]|uniref:glycoside hydrolase family 15 protein n=1 Tax=Telmatospirillum sp. J64-1 TaxID=2502183 RepID=UPI00115DADE7|nr:glycoside hydrolase family 15 protein [Telmatospirillum sp. J64-1]